MKEKPILFSTPMVQAIFVSKKTQTRRIIKPQPDDSGLWNDDKYPRSLDSDLKGWNGTTEETGESKEFKCKYEIGDILWVKETHYRFGYWRKNGFSKSGKQKWMFIADKQFNEVKYFNNPPAKIEKNTYHKLGWYKRNSIFMPKEAARVFLRVTNIRVERLQDISEENARNEGGCNEKKQARTVDYRSEQQKVWVIEFENINGKS